MVHTLAFASGSVFFDATVGPVRLKHPEGLAVAADGAIWCGGDGGEIYRIEPDGSGIELSASTGGLTRGLAFDARGRLYTCDLGHKVVFRLDPSTRQLEQFAPVGDAGPIGVPNYPVVDVTRNVLYVSDSRPLGTPGAGIWWFDLESG